MTRLSAPIESIKDRYDVVVVGSGYGGGITASRLARAGRSVVLLERGREFQPGEYPSRGPELVAEMQVDLPGRRIGSRTGLYDMRVNDHISVFLGCGLGGTSLVNANVALQADPRVFADERWPVEIRSDLASLQDGYRRAEEMLKPNPLPASIRLPKTTALADSAAANWPDAFSRPPINVTFQDHVNHVGVEQKACTLCGDCVSGCNYSAKNTTLMNYLPDAWNHGAEIYTQVAVQTVVRRAGGWVVSFQVLGTGREAFDAPLMFVEADLVVLSAGTLGSTEILLRSRLHGLAVSDQLGKHFTGNGDALGFSYNTDRHIDGVGWGSRGPGHLPAVGPCITGLIDLRAGGALEDGMVIEEGSIPGGLGAFMPEVMAAAAELIGRNTEHGVLHRLEERKREVESQLQGPHHGAVRNTQTYLAMAHDSGTGVMSLEDDRVRVSWPGVGDEPIFQRIRENMAAATKPLGGDFLKDPVWSQHLGDSLVTVHPMGGCVMGENAERGVVNHRGQVFAGTRGTEVHEGLYVSDGSVIPRPLGVNPLLTISGLAERCCSLIAADHGWTIDYTLPSAPRPAPPKALVGVEFTERMAGFFALGADDYAQGAEQGQAGGSSLSFILTIVSEDLDRFINDAAHEAHMAGSVMAPALSATALTATDGVFNLFVVDPDVPETRRMEYAMKLATEEGREYYFQGFKLIHHGKGLLEMWPDTTTLYVTLFDGPSPQSAVLGRGILRIPPADFARQMTTMKATHTDGPLQALEATARFGAFFAGVLYQTYGGIAARTTYFNPSAPPRAKRALRAPAPEVHAFRTDDDVELMLTRYQGGAKGPVMLAHGLGVSSAIFSTDLIDTNMVEFLCAHGYDVWLLDYRASILLPASRLQSTGDDVATRDYPAAVRTIRALTGAETIQAMVHCYGATTFFMAMLAGLEGVRSASVSQIACHVVGPPLTRLKAGLHMPDVVDALGIGSLTAYAAVNEDWSARLFDQVIKLDPVPRNEHCNNAVCHRITFLYSLLYQHEQLNELTHANLHELFGVANISALEHLALMVRKGTVVRADGEDVYMPHLDRLAIPITFVHGAMNDCYLPRSTELTFDALVKVNGPGLYKRTVVPDFGHIDCIYGRDAATHTFPLFLEGLDAGNP